MLQPYLEVLCSESTAAIDMFDFWVTEYMVGPNLFIGKISEYPLPHPGDNTSIGEVCLGKNSLSQEMKSWTHSRLTFQHRKSENER